MKGNNKTVFNGKEEGMKIEYQQKAEWWLQWEKSGTDFKKNHPQEKQNGKIQSTQKMVYVGNPQQRHNIELLDHKGKEWHSQGTYNIRRQNKRERPWSEICFNDDLIGSSGITYHYKHWRVYLHSWVSY